jgi:DNA-binding transcriptional LysR family regulator
MLDVRRLRLLRELARRGTIAAVADALAYTPSAVSQQLAVLEREAGVPLLERTGRRVVLTPAGESLVEHADAIVERLERADAELAGVREGLGGPLRIGMFPSAGRTIVPAALTELERAHPRLQPMVTVVDAGRVGDGLRAGELDVALVHDYDFVPATPDATVDTVPLLTEPMYLAFGGDGPDPAGSSLAELLASWREASWITARPGTTGHAMVVRACEAAGFPPRIRHHVNEFSAVLSFVEAGQGVSLVPELAVAGAPGAVRLTRLPLHRRSYVACRRGAGRHPAVAAFIAALQASQPQ